jgi:hypothetical protein
LQATQRRPKPQQERRPQRTRRRRQQSQPSGRRVLRTTAKRKEHLVLQLYPANTDNPLSAAAAEKQAEAARKKAEKDALLKEEEASLPSKPGKKPPVKKARGLDLSGLDGPSSKNVLSALNATGIDDALDALDLTKGNNDKIDRHPERRFKAAYTAFETRRLDEMASEKGLRRQQKIDQIRKEFEKHPDNPFNQVQGTYNMSKEEMAELRDAEKQKLENRLGA